MIGAGPSLCLPRLGILLGTIVAVMVTLGACATAPERALSRQAPMGAFLSSGARPADPDQFDPRLARWGVIGAMEQALGRPIQVLELSGGGQYGAFGAGFLNGWSTAGTRPQFDLVTGISTGALLATHAFLGTPEDDRTLKRLFTQVERRDIYRGSLWGALFGGPALNRTDPMAAMIARAITPEVLERVAAEFDEGRRLFVAATNLDYKQVWIFSLGLIAKQGGPAALDLYRKVLQAAASPPVVFPPVEIEGHLFGDAAVRENLLLMGLFGSGRIERPPVGAGQTGRGAIYVIVNGSATVPPEAVPEALSPIAGDTLNAILAGRMDTTLVLAYLGARIHDYDFNLLSLPPDVPISGKPLAFDPDEMRRVFEAGYRLGRAPNPWLQRPPPSDQLGPWTIRLFEHLDRLPR
jgi:predicted acylesterase/phospholipase RssA